MRLILKAFLCLLATGVTAAWGVTIDLLDPSSRVLWNTGVDAAGGLGANASVDAHYSLTGPAPVYVVTTSKPSGWRSNVAADDGSTLYDDRAAWISQAQPGTTAFSAVPSETFTFFTTFTLPADAPFWNVTMTASVWADNRPDAIRLFDPVAGTTLLTVTPPVPPGVNGDGRYGFVGPGSSGSNTPYSGGPNTLSYAGLVAGRTYQIQFDVFNRPLTGNNNSGLFVQWIAGSATGVPEPGSYALMGTAGLALFFLVRRQRSRAAR